MKLDYAEVRHLLRRSRSGALGSVSLAMPGFPFVSLLPYVLDEACRPLFLLSGLAEHTKNLLADPRASLLVAEGQGGLLEQARLTLLGTVERVELDVPGRVRFLRYSPESEKFLALGDFSFFRMAPLKARFIRGFGRMGWMDATPMPHVLAPGEEAALLEVLARRAPAGLRVEGVDAEGLDIVAAGVSRRIDLTPTHTGLDALLEAAVNGMARAGLTMPADPPAGIFA